MEQYLLNYIVLVNIGAFCLVWYDKRQARRGKWRIPERQLWVAGLIGGSLGLYFGMSKFRHKTRHMSFTFGVPTLIAVQGFLLWYIQH